MSCSICYERFISPVALPCGHVFCQECIRRTVDSAKSPRTKHSCPTCRATFTILNLDPNLIPPYLRPHILPTLRPLFLDGLNAGSTPSSATSTTSVAESMPLPQSQPSNPSTPASPSTSAPSLVLYNPDDVTTLHATCTTWRQRAETHASANTSLLAFARRTRDCALRLRAERDMYRNECVLLKRKLQEMHEAQSKAAWVKLEEESDTLNSPSPFAPPRPSQSRSACTVSNKYLEADAIELELRRRLAAPARVVGPPVYLLQFESPNAVRPEVEDALSGPPMKRRKESPVGPKTCDTGAHKVKMEPDSDVRCSVRSISDLLA